MKRAPALLLATGLLLGCAKPNQLAPDQAYQAKMRLVVDEAIRQTQDPAEKEEFKSGKVFVNIEGLDMPVVGVSVPIKKSKVLVSFTLDYFQANDVPVLARDALHDFRRVVADQERE